MEKYHALTPGEVADRLCRAEHPAVVLHTRADGDTVGSAAALMAMFRALGQPAVYMSDAPVPARLAFLTEGWERVTDPTGYTPLAVDVASPRQLGALLPVLTGEHACAFMIDHHATGEPFADYCTLPEASSAAEVVFGIAEELIRRGKLTLTRDIATPLYAGIVSDTGGFRFSNTTPATHRAAAELLAAGVDGADICRRLFDAKTAEVLRAEGMVAAGLRQAPGGITYVVISRADRVAAGLSDGDFETAVDIVRSLAGTQVAFTVRENDAGEYKVSLRSVSRDVAAVAARFGGGGHIRAAGCAVVADSAAQAAEKILAVLVENK